VIYSVIDLPITQGEFKMAVDPFGAMFGGLMMMYVLIIVFVVIWFVIGLILAIWVYKDAQNRGMDNPALWLIIVILIGCIGCIIYLVVRPKD